MATRDELYGTATIRIASAARPLFAAVVFAGALAAAAGWRPAAVLIVVGVAATLGAQLVVGIAAYRRAMRRPWPEVAPLADEDEW